MKKLIALITTVLLLGYTTDGWCPPPTGGGSGSGVQVAADCDVAAYYPIGTLCQSSVNGKLFKGTGAAIVELAAGASGDFLANGTVPMTNGATSAGFIDFLEDSSNGASYMRLYGPAALAGNIFLVMPDTQGATGGQLYFSSAGTLSVAAAGTEKKIWTMGASIPGWSAYTVDAPSSAGAVLYDNGTNWVRSATPSLTALTLTNNNTLGLGSNSGGLNGSIIFHNGADANTFTVQAGATGAGVNGWILPTANAGGANYLLNVDADGTMGYTDPASLGGGSPALDDVTNPDAAKTFTLLDNNASALSFGSTGKGDIIKVITTDSSEGVTMSGTLGVTGLLTASGGVSGALNGTVGATTPAAGKFTTLEASTSLAVTAAASTGGYIRLLEGTNNGTDYSMITGAADAGTYPSFTFSGSQGSEDLTLTASSDKWTIASTTGATVEITPATKITGTLTTGGTIELGAASDTTLARVSAGVVSIEGNNILTYQTTIDGSAHVHLTAAQMQSPTCHVSNYGQTTADVSIGLPTAAANLSCLFTVSTAQSNHWGVLADTNDAIYIIAAAGTVSSKGTDGAAVAMVAAQLGQSFACYSIQTGASAWDWMCKAIAIGTSTFEAHAAF